jgi:hypothetical protein
MHMHFTEFQLCRIDRACSDSRRPYTQRSIIRHHPKVSALWTSPSSRTQVRSYASHVHTTIHAASNAPMPLPSPAPPTGNRFATVTQTDHGALIFIAAILTLVFTFLVLVARIAAIKWRRWDLDDLVLVCAKVSLQPFPLDTVSSSQTDLLTSWIRPSALASGSAFSSHITMVLERPSR